MVGSEMDSRKPDFVASKQQSDIRAYTSVRTDQHLYYSLYDLYASECFHMHSIFKLVSAAKKDGLRFTLPKTQRQVNWVQTICKGYQDNCKQRVNIILYCVDMLILH